MALRAQQVCSEELFLNRCKHKRIVLSVAADNLPAGGKQVQEPVLNEIFSEGSLSNISSRHVTQKSMISADLAANGPQQM